MNKNPYYSDKIGLIQQLTNEENVMMAGLEKALNELMTEEDSETFSKNYDVFMEKFSSIKSLIVKENLEKLEAMKPNIEKITTKFFEYKKEKMVAGFKYTLYIAVLVAIIAGALLVILWIPLVILAFLSETFISYKKWYGTLSLGDRFKRSLYGPFYGIFLIFRRVNSDYF